MSLENQLEQLTAAVKEITEVLKCMSDPVVLEPVQEVPTVTPSPSTVADAPAPPFTPEVTIRPATETGTPPAPPPATETGVPPAPPAAGTDIVNAPPAPPAAGTDIVNAPPAPPTVADATGVPPAPPAAATEPAKKPRKIAKTRAAKINDLMVTTAKNLGDADPVRAALSEHGVSSPADLNKDQADALEKKLKEM